MGKDRRYPVRCGQGYFVAGTISGGRQVLIWHDVADIYVLNFDAEGKLVGKEVVPLLRPAKRGSDGFYRSDPSFEKGVEDQLETLEQRLEFAESDILIQSFSDEELGSGIDPMPAEYEEFLSNPSQFDSETQESLSTDTRRWIEEGRFLMTLYYREYWVSKTGEVMSHS